MCWKAKRLEGRDISDGVVVLSLVFRSQIEGRDWTRNGWKV